MGNWLLWLKALHIISVIAWMAGLLYLPRIFVYHADTPVGSPPSDTFKIMERRLLKAIMNPAMIAVWVTGPILAYGTGDWMAGWLHAKIALVLAMSAFHGFLAKITKDFARDSNKRKARFFRIINEIPTILMIFIVILVVVQPF